MCKSFNFITSEDSLSGGIDYKKSLNVQNQVRFAFFLIWLMIILKDFDCI